MRYCTQRLEPCTNTLPCLSLILCSNPRVDRETQSQLNGKKVLMYCTVSGEQASKSNKHASSRHQAASAQAPPSLNPYTTLSSQGGIRCERASALLDTMARTSEGSFNPADVVMVRYVRSSSTASIAAALPSHSYPPSLLLHTPGTFGPTSRS